MVGVAAKGLGYDLFELRFDVVDSLSGRQTGSVADAEDMRVDGKSFLAESSVQDNICSLAADFRQ